MVVSLRCVVNWMYLDRILHRGSALSDAREFGASGDDEGGLWGYATELSQASSVRTRISLHYSIETYVFRWEAVQRRMNGSETSR